MFNKPTRSGDGRPLCRTVRCEARLLIRLRLQHLRKQWGEVQRNRTLCHHLLYLTR